MPDLDLDDWLSAPTIRVAYRRESTATPDELWQAASTMRVDDSGLLGRLIRWRIPRLPADLSFDQLFRHDPFLVLVDGERTLASGLVGQIWTLRRDYPTLADPDQFREWSVRGTVRVVFGNWVAPSPSGGSVLRSETRVQAVGAQGQVGLATLRPLIRAFQGLIVTEGLDQTVRRAERR